MAIRLIPSRLDPTGTPADPKARRRGIRGAIRATDKLAGAGVEPTPLVPTLEILTARLAGYEADAALALSIVQTLIAAGTNAATATDLALAAVGACASHAAAKADHANRCAAKASKRRNQQWRGDIAKATRDAAAVVKVDEFTERGTDSEGRIRRGDTFRICPTCRMAGIQCRCRATARKALAHVKASPVAAVKVAAKVELAPLTCAACGAVDDCAADCAAVAAHSADAAAMLAAMVG